MALSAADAKAEREQLRERLLVRLGGFIKGIGLSIEEAREIVERAIADCPHAAPPTSRRRPAPRC